MRSNQKQNYYTQTPTPTGFFTVIFIGCLIVGVHEAYFAQK